MARLDDAGDAVSKNLFYDNVGEDIFMEVNHGPYLIDNNIFGSYVGVLDISQGGAYVHNLLIGRLLVANDRGRYTPYHLPHSTEVAGLSIGTGRRRPVLQQPLSARKAQENGGELPVRPFGI